MAPDDPEAFIDAVRELVEHPQVGRRLGALGRQWVVREAQPGGGRRGLRRARANVGRRRCPTLQGAESPLASPLVASSSSPPRKSPSSAKSGKGKKVRFQGGTLFPIVVVIVVRHGTCTDRVRPPEPARRRCIGRRSCPITGTTRTASTCATHGSSSAATPRRPWDGRASLRISARESTATTTASSTATRSSVDAGRLERHARRVPRHVRRRSSPTTKLTLPETQRAALPYQQETGVFEDGETTCTSRRRGDAELKVVVWDNFTDTDNGTDQHHRLRQHPSRQGRHGLRPSPSCRTTPTSACRRGLPTCRRSARSTAAAVPDRTDARRSPVTRTPAPLRIDRHGNHAGNHDGLMRAVVLVGGFGTRLRPLTSHRAQADAAGRPRPIIDRLVDRLARGGVTEVMLALGFKPEPFIEAFPDGRCAGVTLTLRRRARAARHRLGRSASPPTSPASTTRSWSPTAT